MVTSGFPGNGCDSLPVGGAERAVTSGFPGNGCDSLPVGGAVRAGELAVSTVTTVI